jgi:hypothetical protein
MSLRYRSEAGEKSGGLPKAVFVDGQNSRFVVASAARAMSDSTPGM